MKYNLLNIFLSRKKIRSLENMLASISSELHNKKISQIQLFHYYQSLYCKDIIPDWKNVGFREYSQTNEDGLLLFIFSIIGFTNRVLVDIACGNPEGSNSANLICNWGFTGLLVDGDENSISTTKEYYKKHLDTYIFPPRVKCEFVSAENVNTILSENNVVREIDLLLLDVDGIDYWLWNKIDAIQPRVVVVEACTYLGREKAVTVPYDPKFNRFEKHPDYMGASILAYYKLGRSKGYRMVACNRFGFNLFFVREDITSDKLYEISVDDCFYFEPYELKIKRLERLKAVSHYDWVDVK